MNNSSQLKRIFIYSIQIFVVMKKLIEFCSQLTQYLLYCCCWKYLLNLSFSISFTTSAIKLRGSNLNRKLCFFMLYLPWLRCLFILDFIDWITVSAPFKVVEYGGIVRNSISLLFTYSFMLLVLWIFEKIQEGLRKICLFTG